MSDITALPVTLGLNWLANSHIRHANSNPISHGGMNQGYDWIHHCYPIIYSEITGYSISLFVNAYRWTDNASYLKMAREAADFIIRIKSQVKGEAHHGAVPFGYSLAENRYLDQYFSFDAAMCLQGLLDLNTVQPSQDLVVAARSIGNWLIRKMQRENGSFYSRYDAETGDGQHSGLNFFDDFGCLHTKHVIGLLKLYRLCNDAQLLDAVRRVCEWVLTLQDSDGAIRASERQPQVVSHGLCYAVEGLLYAHADLGDDRFLQAAVKAGNWLKNRQGRDGSIQIGYERRWWRPDRKVKQQLRPIRVSDATSQAIRIWLILYYRTGRTDFQEASQRAATFLNNMQCRSSSDPDQVGGFYYWPGHPILYAWSTMFAVHAIYALNHVQRECGYEKLLEELF